VYIHISVGFSVVGSGLKVMLEPRMADSNSAVPLFFVVESKTYKAVRVGLKHLVV
jgi:hypothetical protein